MSEIAHWTMDDASGGITDSVASFDLAESGTGFTYSGSSPGSLGSYVTLDGNGYFTLSSLSMLRAVGQASFSGWFNTSATGTTQYLLRLTNLSTAQLRFSVYLHSSSGNITFGGRSNSDSGNQTVRLTEADHRDGSWHHVAVVVDYANDMALAYVDGVLATAGVGVAFASAATQDAASGYLRIGDGFVGSLDDLRVYDHKLTPRDIQLLYKMGATTSALEILRPVPYQTFQQSGGVGDITVCGIYPVADAPTSIEARFNGGTWTELDASPSGGSFSGTLSGQTAARGTFEVRYSNDTGTTDSVANVQVGDVIGWSGQSNMCGRGDNSQTFGGAATSIYDINGWSAMATGYVDPDPGGYSYLPLLSTAIETETGMPLGILSYADGGTAFSTFWAVTETHSARMTRIIYDADPGGMLAFCWGQGEADAVAGSVDQAAYQAGVEAMREMILGMTGIDCPFLCEQTGSTPTAATAADINKIRDAQIDLVDNDAGSHLGAVGYDRADLHWTSDADMVAISGRWFRAIEKAAWSGTAGSPRISSATYSGTTITLTYNQTLATEASLTTSAWTVTDGAGSRTVSAASASGTAVTLTVDQSLADTVTVRLASGDTGSSATVPENASGDPAIAESFTADQEVVVVFPPAVRHSAAPLGVGISLSL